MTRPSSPKSSVRAALLRWYRANRRDLPWRRTRDAYGIWVSEIMLQQTRVDVVVPYWKRFLERFPTVSALAHADEQEVLAAWSGLGYYRRARMLHQAAGCVVREHAGCFPDDPEAVRALPGIGRYTAGAILSIAFDRPEPILDGNVIRVLCRLHGLEGDPARGALSKELWNRATELADGPEPGELNQALMELGALICTPASARCDECPLSRRCEARRTDRVGTLPTRIEKTPPKKETWTVAYAARRGRVLLRRRDGEELLQGMWELPTVVASPRPRNRAEQRLSELIGATLELGAERAELRRGISGRRVTMRVHDARVTDRPGRHCRWLTLAQARERALTTPTRLLLDRFDGEATRAASRR